MTKRNEYSKFDTSDERPLRGIKVGVDIDGVLADFVAALKPAAAVVLDCRSEDLTDSPDWNFGEWGVENQEQFEKIYALAARNGLWSDTPLIPGALDGVRQLRSLGAMIRLVTARPDPLPFPENGNQSITETEWWARSRRIPNARIIHTSAKQNTTCDVHVEDAPYQIEPLLRAGKKVVLLDQSWNQEVNVDDDRIVRAVGWRDVVRGVIAFGAPAFGALP